MFYISGQNCNSLPYHVLPYHNLLTCLRTDVFRILYLSKCFKIECDQYDKEVSSSTLFRYTLNCYHNSVARSDQQLLVADECTSYLDRLLVGQIRSNNTQFTRSLTNYATTYSPFVKACQIPYFHVNSSIIQLQFINWFMLSS